MRVDGRVVLVTGAANGIGAATAARLAALGARLVLVDRDEAALKELAERLGERALACPADVRDAAALEEAVARGVARFGGLDVVIANAGVCPPAATVAAIDPAEFERTVEINLLGVWRTVRAALPHVVERRGYVLVIASAAAVIPTPFLASYAASKAGVEAFARALRLEVAHTGTRVGVGYFGLIDTSMGRGLVAERALGGTVAALPGFARRSVPVEDLARLLANGVARRAGRVSAPGYVQGLLLARGLLPPVERALARTRGLGGALRTAGRGGR